MTQVCCVCKRILELDMQDTRVTHGLCTLCMIQELATISRLCASNSMEGSANEVGKAAAHTRQKLTASNEMMARMPEVRANLKEAVQT